MKKTALTLAILLLAAILTGCGKCVHAYTATVTAEATYEAAGEISYVCDFCGDTYTETIEKLTRHEIPTSVLDKALSKCKYYSNPFSISVGKLVNSAMEEYEIQYLTGEEAIAKGYISKSQIADSVNLEYVYYAIISGDTMMNPEIPYMTEYESEAVKVWMIFNENDRLQNSGVTLCDNLKTCAFIIMASNY